MTRSTAIVGSIVFFFLAPGVLAFAIPLVLSGWPLDPLYRDLPLVSWTGFILTAIALAALADSFARFALEGLGTPAPIAPTKHLVVHGLYRHVRNPMYVAVITIILGQTLWFGSAAILLYAALVWLGFTAFVLAYEEPILRQTYGEQYRIYCEHVGRWIPRLTPWSATS